jgi:hypothetical protein
LDLSGNTGVMRGLKPLGTFGGGWQFHTIGNGHDFRGNPERLEDEFIVINELGYNGNVSAENEQPEAQAEGRMVAAVTNIVAANYTPGKLHLPDATN